MGLFINNKTEVSVIRFKDPFMKPQNGTQLAEMESKQLNVHKANMHGSPEKTKQTLSARSAH